MQISLLWPRYAQKSKFKMAAAAILNFIWSGIVGNSNPRLANIYQCTKFDENNFIYDRDMAKIKFKMVAAMLNFNKSVILGHSNPCMANIYPQTKFGANRSRNGWDTPVYVFPLRWLSTNMDSFTQILDCPRSSPWWAKFSVVTALWFVQTLLRYCDFTTSRFRQENAYSGQF